MTDWYALPSHLDDLEVSGATPLPRTLDEISAYAKSEGPGGLFAFHREVALQFLPYSHAKPFLKEDATAGEWDPHVYPATSEVAEALARDYCRFGWGKVMDHRGISAARTLEKLHAYLWLLGDEESLAVIVDDDAYGPYGAPVLAAICKKRGWPMPDGEEATAGAGKIGAMMQGEPCATDCEMGCLS